MIRGVWKNNPVYIKQISLIKSVANSSINFFHLRVHSINELIINTIIVYMNSSNPLENQLNIGK
ncbi:Na+-translocating ferredoxin:NAD+ oxidoreductase RnfE subunit [Cytobacillus purgationiresistens]|uniref:Na+-translocating ferredoxin:NAD+ oxidoreductase RnfE subunit n=1 Tax=Cytobacillus purgationiresistens TaxID=863449 RepID=A0ABU0AP44_9BACI|nr:Na+-translocating ferredoxin:NAD+ oxidoreductase RnfE subunit [Cytobacillus purgationiresistens]